MYVATGCISLADMETVNDLCRQIHNVIDSETKSVVINDIRMRLAALEASLKALEITEHTQDNRLTALENTCANTELTTSEILDMYTGAQNG